MSESQESMHELVRPWQYLTHARHDPSHCLTPGLFCSLPRGQRKKRKLDVKHIQGGTLFEFSGPEPLAVDDLRVMQALVAMATDGMVLSPEPQTEGGRQLRLSLETRWDAAQSDAVVIRGSFRAVAQIAGYANPNDTAKVRRCIERLWKTSVIVQVGNLRYGFRMLSEYAGETRTRDGRLYVAMNPLIAHAVFGGENTKYIYISMEEVRGLKTDPARLIYQRLCGWVDPGGASKQVALDTLCSYVWPDEAKPETMKRRRQKTRRALDELADVGWTIREYGQNKWRIKRPPVPPDNLPLIPR